MLNFELCGAILLVQMVMVSDAQHFCLEHNELFPHYAVLKIRFILGQN